MTYPAPPRAQEATAVARTPEIQLPQQPAPAEIQDLGDAVDGLGDQPLDPEWVTLERIGSFIGLAIVGAVTLIGAGAGSLAAGPWWPLVIAAWSLLMLLLSARAWFWPQVAYKHRSYRLDDRGLVIRRGVFWRSVAHVARSRVQHTDVSQGPLERYFELGTLTVHTAGTQFASVALDGLSHREAERIRDILIEAGEGDGV